MGPESRLIVLEDACSIDCPPEYDRDHINDLWASVAQSSEVYSLTDTFHIQVILDFVAVQLLANFTDVEMPCSYKRSDEWECFFRDAGFRIENAHYLGFPRERDIDVPQAFFVLKL